MNKIDKSKTSPLTKEKKEILKNLCGSAKIPIDSNIVKYKTKKDIKRCVLMAADGTFYKSESTRLGADLDNCHIFQTIKQAEKAKERLEYAYGSETTYTIRPIKVII